MKSWKFSLSIIFRTRTTLTTVQIHEFYWHYLLLFISTSFSVIYTNGIKFFYVKLSHLWYQFFTTSNTIFVISFSIINLFFELLLRVRILSNKYLTLILNESSQELEKFLNQINFMQRLFDKSLKSSSFSI